MIVLETERLLLRRPLLNDLESMVALAADPMAMKNHSSGGPTPPEALREELKAEAGGD